MAPFAEQPRLIVNRQGDLTTARLEGCASITDANVKIFGRMLADLIVGQAPRRLEFDLSCVQYLASAALAKLISLNAALRAADGRLVLENLQPAVREIFTATLLDRTFEISPDA